MSFEKKVIRYGWIPLVLFCLLAGSLSWSDLQSENLFCEEAGYDISAHDFDSFNGTKYINCCEELIGEDKCSYWVEYTK